MKMSKQSMLKYADKPLQGKVCLITGFTSGIGHAAAVELASKGATLVLVARSAMRGESIKMDIRSDTGNDNLFVLQADLAERRDIENLATIFLRRFDRLDILINNAGALFRERRENAAGVELTFAVNHLAYFLLVDRLLEVLKKTPGARIVNVASGAHRSAVWDPEDFMFEKKYRGFQSYARTKLYNILFTNELAARLADSDITVNSVHPGNIATEIARDYPGGFLWKVFTASPEKGADTLVFLASDPALAGRTGGYYVRRKLQTPAAPALERKNGQILWDYTRNLLNGRG